MSRPEPFAPHPSIQDAPLLFWRIDLLKRSFEPLNESGPGLLAKDNYRFFKDKAYREEMILSPDHVAVNSAISDVKFRVPVSAIFRIQSGNVIHWFKLSGWPVGGHRYYEGTVEEISEHMSQLQDIFTQHGRRLYMTDEDDYPVAVFRKKDRQLVRYNDAFAELAGISVSSQKKYRLDNLVAAEIKLPLLEERLLLERRLSETLFLTPTKGRKTQALCLLECFIFQGTDLIRFSVVDVLNTVVDSEEDPSGQKKIVETETDALCNQLKESSSIVAMLDAIYARKDLLPGLDAIMYSDIHARKNSVFVYARGNLFGTLEPGSQYPYSGTIAENIEKEELEYLIVDDTQASIKAIDWALFVPHGVRSYIAKALYTRGAMRTVLIFCSATKRAFHDDQVGKVSKIATTFHRRLKQIKNS